LNNSLSVLKKTSSSQAKNNINYYHLSSTLSISHLLQLKSPDLDENSTSMIKYDEQAVGLPGNFAAKIRHIPLS